MTITKEFASKLAVAFVAVAMVFSAFATSAKAQTTEDLQQMINDLLAQVAALQSQTGQGGTSASGVCPYTWTRDLSSGSTGADVMKLQQFLNADADTRVAASGVGSVGMETEYYGPATAAAVSKFQVKYRSEILSPASIVNPTGYFGPSSRAKANGICVTAPVVVDDSADDSADDSSDDSADDSSDDSSSMTLSGEASLNDATLDDASDDTIEEGAEDAEVAELTVEFEDGDAEISRIDVTFNPATSGVDPWDVLETISLWIDGDKVAEENADDEDDYLSDDMTMRFTGLDIFAEEDEELEIIIAVTLQGSIDQSDLGDVDVSIDSLRFFDADGVATTDENPTAGDVATFTIEEEGVDDELIVKTSSNDLDSMTIQVEDDSKSDWFTAFVFDLDTDDSVNDIEINEISITIDTASSTGSAADLAYADLVDDIELVIDGVTIDDLVVVGGTATTADSAFDASTVLRFDVDGDVVIDAGDRVEVEVMVRFKSLDAADEGATIRARVTSLNAEAILAEGADDLDLSQISGAATGDTHTLRTAGIDVSPSEMDAKVTVNDGSLNDYATFIVEVEVTAFEQDVYIAIDDAVSIDYDLTNSAGTPYTVPAASSSVVVTSTADDDGTYFEITEGETETLTLTVTYTPVVANTAVRLVMNSISFAPTAVAPTQSQTTLPANDYRTAVVTIVN